MSKKGLSLEEAFKALNGRGKVTESKKEKHPVKESVVEKVDLDYYDLEEVVENIRDDLDFNLNIDDIIDAEMDEDGIVTIYLKDKKLIVDEYDNVKIIPTKPVSEDLTSDVKIPEPYNKYYQVVEVDEIDDYAVGDQIEGYDMRILAYLDAKPEYEDILEEPYAVLTDDKDYPVCVIVGRRVYNVYIEDLPQE